jgi:hypothetical protein
MAAKPNLKGFTVGAPAPRTLFLTYVGGWSDENLVLASAEGTGGVLVFEGDTVTEGVAAVIARA